MPSTSGRQHRFMEAIAHSSSFAKKAGVPQSVGKDFAAADDKAGITKTHNGQPVKRHSGSSPRNRDEHMADLKSHGKTHREIASDMGVSKSTAHRRVSNMMRQGFVNKGSAG